jgi:lipopolysaccharide/colanic/teichoic acid biosynthesis glycosyltransferase
MQAKKKNGYLFLKRTIDIFGSLLGICVLSPLIILCTIITSCTSLGGPFFIQERLGRNKKTFHMIKFRSMKKGVKQIGQENLTIEEQKRMTTVWGRFMRMTSIDEIPQLFNILAGSMSFIGPRPGMVTNGDGLIRARDSFVPSAYEVKPGLSGYAQIHMKRNPDVTEKAREDSYYVQHMNLWFDTKIFVYSFLFAFGVVKGR